MMTKKTTTRSKISPSRLSRKPIQVDLSRLRKHLDPSLKSVWVDFMQVSMCSEVIPTSALTFFTLHDRKVLAEACRVNMTTAQLRDVADVICRAIDYYPKRRKVSPKKKR